MRTKLLLFVFSFATVFCFADWKSDASSTTSSAKVETIKKKKKKKNKRKKPKKKKQARKKNEFIHTKKLQIDSIKRSWVKNFNQRRIDKNLKKLHKKNDKSAKKKQDFMDDRKSYTRCDSASLTRTSKDTLILPKYISIYRTLGGVCYILHLQQMTQIYKSSTGFYYVIMRKSKDQRAPAAWQTYLFCPIGKPNGTIALRSIEGDTIQMCSYLNEKKNGIMYFLKKNKGVIYQEKYVNDVKVWGMIPEEED